MGVYDKNKTIEFLKNNNIEFEKIEHEAYFSMSDYEEDKILKMGNVVKNLFLRNANGKIHYLVSIPATAKVDIKQIAKELNSTRLSFASDERMEKYLKVKSGSVSPLNILNDENKEVIVVFDERLIGVEKIGVHPNDNTMTCFMKYDDLKKIIVEHGNTFVTIKINEEENKSA